MLHSLTLPAVKYHIHLEHRYNLHYIQYVNIIVISLPHPDILHMGHTFKPSVWVI
jgi:hypothetical protein